MHESKKAQTSISHNPPETTQKSGTPEPVDQQASFPTTLFGSKPLTPDTILYLQRTIGNKAVQRLLTKHSNSRPKTRSFSFPQKTQIAQNIIQREPVDWQNDNPPGSKKAIEDHQNHLNLLKQVYLEALNIIPTNEFEERLHNSAKWIKQGKIKLWAYSPTHDQDARSIRRYKNGNTLIWLATDVSASQAQVYDKDLDERKNTKPASYAADGFASGTDVCIIFPNYTSPDKEKIKSTLRHEVQHLADLHSDVDSLSKNHPFNDNWQRYITEFRAHSFQDPGTFPQPLNDGPIEKAVPADDPKAIKHQWKNSRQLAIFEYLYKSEEYRFVKQAWDFENDNYKADLAYRPFQKKVLEFDQPYSINPLNSPELDNFYKIFVQDEPDKDAKEYLTKFEALSKKDLEILEKSLNQSQILKTYLDKYINTYNLLPIDKQIEAIRKGKTSIWDEETLVKEKKLLQQKQEEEKTQTTTTFTLTTSPTPATEEKPRPQKEETNKPSLEQKTTQKSDTISQTTQSSFIEEFLNFLDRVDPKQKINISTLTNLFQKLPENLSDRELKKIFFSTQWKKFSKEATSVNFMSIKSKIKAYADPKAKSLIDQQEQSQN